MSLQPIEFEPAPGPIPEPVAAWIQACRAAAKKIDCFDYIPSCPELLYAFLRMVPCRSYCEWGSGIGIGTGIAAALGMKASGIEINPELAQQSRSLMTEFGLEAEIVCDSYHEVTVPSDLVFVYCWPGQVNAVRERFENAMPSRTWLLMADGAERFSAYLLVHDER